MKGKLEEDRNKKNQEKRPNSHIISMKGKLEEDQSKKKHRRKTDSTDHFYERQIRRRSKAKKKHRRKTFNVSFL